MSEDLLKYTLMCYKLERKREESESLDVGGGVASFSFKLKCIHPTLLPQQTCFWVFLGFFFFHII